MLMLKCQLSMWHSLIAWLISHMAVNSMISVEPLQWLGLIGTIISGAIVGIERQMQGKPVGIKTSILVCLGTYIFVVMANHLANEMADQTRVVGQVVTGIGFLGAGVILSRDGLVSGVTSAAVIWVLAAIGVIIASSQPYLGIKVAILTVLILVGIDLLEATFVSLQKGVHRRLNIKYNKNE